MIRLHRLFTVALVVGGLTLPADTIQLRDGRRVDGTFMGGDSRQVKVLDADGKVQTFNIGDVDTIRFKSATVTAGAAASPPSLARPPAARAAAVPRAAANSRATVPAGAVLTVRMIDSIDSDAYNRMLQPRCLR